MSYQANVLRVMIASPGDVAEERRIITEELHRWNDANATSRRLILQPIKWETHSTPQMTGRPQDIINRDLLLDADVVVAIFATRIGTATAEFISGTVEEIKRHVALGKLAMPYFSRIPVDPNSIDSEQFAAVKLFKTECKDLGLYGEYTSFDDLRRGFGQHLTIELNRPQYKWLSTLDTLPTEKKIALSEDEIQLLKVAANDRNGEVHHFKAIGGESLQSNEQEFIEETTRSVARWKAVLKNLTDLGFFNQETAGVYTLTDAGFASVDAILHAEGEKERAEKLSEQGARLLQWAIAANGQLTVVNEKQHYVIVLNGSQIPESETPRQVAEWRAAVDELVTRGFITRDSTKIYRVSALGYTYADKHLGH